MLVFLQIASWIRILPPYWLLVPIDSNPTSNPAGKHASCATGFRLCSGGQLWILKGGEN